METVHVFYDIKDDEIFECDDVNEFRSLMFIIAMSNCVVDFFPEKARRGLVIYLGEL